MDNTLQELASALGVEPLTAEEQTLLLDCTRDLDAIAAALPPEGPTES